MATQFCNFFIQKLLKILPISNVGVAMKAFTRKVIVIFEQMSIVRLDCFDKN